MPEAKLRLTIPDGIWIGDVSRACPETRVRVLAAIPDDRTGVGLAELSGPAVGDALAGMADADEITAVEVLQERAEEALVQFETTNPLLLFPARGSGVPLQMPFDIRDGEATWEVTAPHDRLSALGDQLDQFGISYTVEYVQEFAASGGLLTDRQRELVAAAVDRGYYDTPRDCTLTELAESVGIAKSTCSGTLHRAEERIVKAFVDRQPTMRESHAEQRTEQVGDRVGDQGRDQNSDQPGEGGRDQRVGLGRESKASKSANRTQ